MTFSWTDSFFFFLLKWRYKRSAGSPETHQVGTFMSEGMLCLDLRMKALFVISILIIPKCRKMDSGICQKCHTGSQRISLKALSQSSYSSPWHINSALYLCKEKVGKPLSPAEDEAPSIWSRLLVDTKGTTIQVYIHFILILTCFSSPQLVHSFHLPASTTLTVRK